jgi:ubiquinone/menaquinone biosynthesis C-methylase UbiE
MIAAEEGQSTPLYPWHRTVLNIIPDLNGKCVLEIGCGRGDFAWLLGQRYPGAEIIATDFSTAAITYAQSKIGPNRNVTFQAANAQALPFSDASFDYVISCECLEHVEAPREMVSEIVRCLKPGGGFVVTTENYFNGMILAWIKAWLTRTPFSSGSGFQPRENFFVFWQVRRMIKEAGLQITHMESNHFVWLLLPSFSPDTFFRADFGKAIWRRLFRPFGRHFTYQGIKPELAETI